MSKAVIHILFKAAIFTVAIKLKVLGRDSSEVGAQAHNRLFKHILDFGLLETWIELDELFGAISCKSISTSVVLEKSAQCFVVQFQK